MRFLLETLTTQVETERLILRPFQSSDLDTYAKWLSDERVMGRMGDGSIRNYAEAWNNLAWVCGHWTLRKFGPWAVEEKHTRRLIGRIGLFYPEGWPDVELIWLLDPQFWGLGYATEGARASAQFALEQLRLPHVISLIRPDNTNSIAVAKRLGMAFESEHTHNRQTYQKYVLNRV